MPALPKPSAGSSLTDVSVRLKVDGSEAVDGVGTNPTGTLFSFGTYVQGSPGSPGIVVGPTPPSDRTLLWVDTSI